MGSSGVDVDEFPRKAELRRVVTLEWKESGKRLGWAGASFFFPFRCEFQVAVQESAARRVTAFLRPTRVDPACSTVQRRTVWKEKKKGQVLGSEMRA